MSQGLGTGPNETAQQAIKLEATASRSKKDLVRISTGGSTGANDDATLADDTDAYDVAVCNQDADSGDVYQAIYAGTVKVTVPSGTYTAGNGLHILDGALADSGGVAEAPTSVTTRNDVGVILVGGTTVTEITVTLYGKTITAQT